MTFTMFSNRLDRSLTCFHANDNLKLLSDVCTNSATGYVRTRYEGGPVSVPAHAAAAVKAHLIRRGWTCEDRKGKTA